MQRNPCRFVMKLARCSIVTGGESNAKTVRNERMHQRGSSRDNVPAPRVCTEKSSTVKHP